MAGNRQYSDTDVHRALEEIQNGASISESARKFGIPRSTLSEKHSGRLPTEHRMGPPTVLSSEEEALLVKWIFHVGDAGFPVTKEQLLDSVQALLKKANRETLFVDNRPGRKWYEGFKRRNPTVVEKECQNLTAARANVTEESLREWYDEVQRFLTTTGDVGILEHPNRIFNMDETGFFLNPKPGKVLARRGQKRVYSKIQGDEKEMITVLVGGSASGLKTPPLVMFPYQRLPNHIVNEMAKGWAFGRSLTGWMTAEAFYEYVTNCFYPWLVKNSIELPVILFVDGHASHITYHLSEICREKRIILIALHPNATHLIQPMDLSVIGPMKHYWLKAAQAYSKSNNGSKLTREKFSKVLQPVLDNHVTVETVANGFVQGGLYPFSADALDYGQLIKRPKLDDDHQLDPVDDFHSTEFLEQFESRLDIDLLLSFKNSELEWAGKCEDTSLFEFWKKVGGRSNPQNETNDAADISSKDVVVEYIGTTYEECFERGQIIEIINLDGAVESVVNNGTNNLHSAKVGSASTGTASITEFSGENKQLHDDPCPAAAESTSAIENVNDGPNELHNAVIGSASTGTASITELNDEQSENENNHLQHDHCPAAGESDSDVGDSTDEETTTDILDTETPNGNVSHIPSGFPKHFQDVLFWPGRTSDASVKNKSKRKPKEKVPAVLTSEDFIEYMKEKEDEKLRLEKEKADRKEEREAKRIEKKKQEEEKAKLMAERKLDKQRKEEEKKKLMAERQSKKEVKKNEKLQKKEAMLEKKKTRKD